MPNAERLDEALRQALTAKQDARVLVELGDFTLRRHAGKLHLVRSGGAPSAHYEKRWRGEKRTRVAGTGRCSGMSTCAGPG